MEREQRAEQSVRAAIQPLWWAPWTRMAMTASPPGLAHLTFATYHYWWQAHVLETLLDAEQRAPEAGRRRLIRQYPWAIGLRNGLRWTNAYYDDIAWFGLALERRERELGMPDPSFLPPRLHRLLPRGIRRVVPGTGGARVSGAGVTGALATIEATLLQAWDTEPFGGGIPWRVGVKFRNVPANGPMAILVARRGHLRRARETRDWMNAHLVCQDTGLVLDGIRLGPDGRTPTRDRAYYTYNQGLVLGTEVEVLRATLDAGHAVGGDDLQATVGRIRRLVEAVEAHMTTDHVVYGFDGRPELGGDAGLFAGILVRYLGLVAIDLPALVRRTGVTATTGEAQATARDTLRAAELSAAIVRASSEAAWDHRVEDARGRLWFPADWRRPARVPTRRDRLAVGASAAGVRSAELPERDMSVQVGAWMALETAARLARHVAEDGAQHRAGDGDEGTGRRSVRQ